MIAVDLMYSGDSGLSRVTKDGLMAFSKKRMRELRESKGWEQKDLAKTIKMSGAAVSRYESGKRIPNANALALIAAGLGTTTEYLVMRTNDPRPLSADEQALVDAFRREDWDAFTAFMERGANRLEDSLRKEGFTLNMGE